jgi:aspartyl-tRNA(Asn)/glutamyl-tRNA(Gln) amidotransferase subunit B
MVVMSLKPTIGIETHIELNTNTKMFCRCAVVDTDEPNISLCPTCIGLPGALPVPNKKAIEFITLLALSTGCEITSKGMFHRKNYFYPDLPKNYQISQFDLPVGLNGESSHSGSGRIESATSTALDFNRSGVPLVEIVTKPVISTSKQAVAYIEELRQLSIDLNISEGRLEKGNLRFDANISVAPEDSTELGTKVEIKNMNSLRSLERAIDYEIQRQTKALEDGVEIVQETRHWDENKEVTSTMRSKEGSADYRYFSDPDLPNMFLSDEFIKEVETLMPLLPKAQREELMTTGLSLSQSNILSKSDDWIKKLYVKVFDQTKDSVASYNWITGELQGQMRKANIEVLPEWFNDDYLSEIIELIKSNKISFTSAKIILTEILTTETTPSKVAEQKNLFQENDSEKISEMINQIIKENQDIVDRIKSGEDKLVGFLVGQLMKQSNGSVNPGMAKELLLKELEG